MVEAVAVRRVAALAGIRRVVLVDVTVLPPLLQQEPPRFIGEFGPHAGEIVIAEPKIDQEVHRRPDPAPPVVLIGIGRIVAGDRGQHPRSPELVRVRHVRLDHARCLIGRRRPAQQRIEVGRREARGKLAGVGSAVEEKAGRLVPQRLQPSPVTRRTFAEFFGSRVPPEDVGDIGQRLAVHHVHPHQPHVNEGHRVVLRVEGNVIVHR